ncbi:MAG: cbb3-type cytochrome c oxidase subunit I [Nitrospinae bacterium]|nr:cbb3-type cytochrome c oxidase subunit I [Nitrospinota bacterium]
MFGLARRYVKTALLFFLCGLALGGWTLASQLAGWAVNPVIISAHTHLTLFGFVIMLIMGVAYWMFPRPAREDLRYSPRIAEINYWLITIGTAMRAAGELSMAVWPSGHFWAPVAAGGALQIGSGVLFCWNIWSRIRAVGSQAREASGERF